MKVRHVVIVAALMAVFLFDSLALPLMPEAIFRFLERAFGLQGWTQIVVFNDLFGLFSGLYWVGLIEAVRRFVLPREEGFLSLLLSKPISRARYVWMQFAPIFMLLLVMGGVLSVALVAKLAAINGLGALAASSVLAMGLSATLLAALLTAASIVLCLVARDTYTAVLLGFLFFAAVVIPAGGYMYRPDLYAGKETLARLVVFPANVLWMHATMLERLPSLLVVSALVILVALGASVAWLARSDIE